MAIGKKADKFKVHDGDTDILGYYKAYVDETSGLGGDEVKFKDATISIPKGGKMQIGALNIWAIYNDDREFDLVGEELSWLANNRSELKPTVSPWNNFIKNPVTIWMNGSSIIFQYNTTTLSNVTLTGNTTLQNVPEGTHTVTIWANDTLGNMTKTSVTFQMEPDLSITKSLIDDSNITNGSILTNAIIDRATIIASNITESANVTLSNLTSCEVRNTNLTNITATNAKIVGGYIEKISGKNASITIGKGGVRVNFINIYKKTKVEDLIVNTYRNTISINASEATKKAEKTVVNDNNIGILIGIIPKLAASNMLIEVAETSINPEEIGTETTPSNRIGNYIHITSSNINTSNTENLTLRIKIPSGYIASTAKINYYNTTLDVWAELLTEIAGGYAVANTSHFSTYTLSGSPESTSTSSSGGGGGSGALSPLSYLSSGSNELTPATYYQMLLSLSSGGKLNKDRFVEVDKSAIASLLMTNRYPIPTYHEAAKFARGSEKKTGDVSELAAETISYNPFRFDPHEDSLIIASSDLEVDSIAAISYAKAMNVPILLVHKDWIPHVTELAIYDVLRFGRRDIILVGGPEAVSEIVEKKLSDIAEVRRIYGKTRIETSIALAKEAYKDPTKVRAIIVTDYENPVIDAALLSYMLDAPLLYVRSSGLSPVVKEYITNHKETMFGPTKIVLMGVDSKVAFEINEVLE